MYYRLKVVPIVVPPLRERRADLLNFVKYFMNIFNKKFNKNFDQIEDTARQALLEYDWPGNIRELKNCIERVVLLERGPVLKAEYMPFDSGGREESTLGRRVDQILSEPIPDEGVDLEALVCELEKEMIVKASEQTGWNQSRTARLLNLKRDKLRYRMKGYNMGEKKEVTTN